jgi:hypothetical protein
MLALAWAATVTASLTGCTGSGQPAPRHVVSSPATSASPTVQARPLTTREVALATRIARREADKKTTRSIISATVTRTAGAVVDDNAGHPCKFRSVLNIKLIGTFNLVHGTPHLPGGSSASPANDDVHAVLISVDASSGAPCLTGVVTGDVTPDPQATVLFTH